MRALGWNYLPVQRTSADKEMGARALQKRDQAQLPHSAQAV